jgi:hypothetical protein
MATQVIGSYAINNLLPIQLRNAGSIAFGPFNVPAGYSSLQVSFDLQQVNSLTAAFTALVEVSFNSGGSWQTVGDYGLDLSVSGYRLVAGQLLRSLTDNFGPGPVRYFGNSVRLMQTESTTRQIRGTLTCSEAVISGVTIIGV